MSELDEDTQNIILEYMKDHVAAARLDAGRAFIRFLLTGAEDPGADESVVTVTTGLLERYLTDDAALARIVAPED